VKRRLLEDIERLYDAMNRRDVAAMREVGRKHPDFSWESNQDELDSPGRLDAKEVFAYSQDLFEIFDELDTEIIETIDLGTDQIIFVVRHRVRGAASGASVERQEVHLWTARDDRIESLREYGTVEEARTAAAAP
jgi:ketosteroid isomerase-like protein